MRKGLLLCGGSGSRLRPLTTAVNKQLLPVYDKPLIYYPLDTLIKADVQDILVIVGSEQSKGLFQKQLQEIEKATGIFIDYAVQEKPNGIAEAFLIAEEFLDGDAAVLALGDNIFHGHQFDVMLPNIGDDQNVIFGCQVKNPGQYGVAEFNKEGQVISIEEKPQAPKSNYAIPGLYFYDNSVVDKAKTLSPSLRGELEITDLNNLYIQEGKLKCFTLPAGTAWFDAGTVDDLLEASNFVRAIQERTGTTVGLEINYAESN